MRQYAAHIRRENPNDPESTVIDVQSINEHAHGVAKKAADFAKPFGGEEQAEICGLAHDIGKYSKGFQKRIWENSQKVDHSTAGAKEIMKKPNMFKLLCAYCVAGHHAGLMNYKTLRERMNKSIEDYEKYETEIELRQVPDWKGVINEKSDGFCGYFFTKMLFSCLVDADYLDTESFMKPGVERHVAFEGLSSLKDKFDYFIQDRCFLSGNEGINYWRSDILKRCIECGDNYENGIFTLSVPTGGGKTISSLAFALHHAVKHHQSRVIYVVPYCAIIDQTLDVFNTILGSENVLAHYSEADYEDTDEYKKLAAENWDMPVIVTTAVQFFESLFSNKTSKCRKIHNIANSVIVFDEAQTLPCEYLDPCVCAIAELATNYNATCILCTATQPPLGERFKEYYPQIKIAEICSDPKKLYELFRRVSYQDVGKLTDEQLVSRIKEYEQVLCIVSTRAQARNIYEMLPEEGRVHLSTLMTPKRRKEVIRSIKGLLEKGEPCRVISTSLIEAGVDLDFPVVFRSIAGLDSIIQAGGRCNREGKKENAEVFVFRPDAKYKLPAALRRPTEVADIVMRNKNDIFSLDAIESYFSKLYYYEGNLDYYSIVKNLHQGIRQKDLKFETIANEFHLISNQGVHVIFVPEDEESKQIAESIMDGRNSMDRYLYRKIGKYCVNVYDQQYKALLPALYVVDANLAILSVPEEYNTDTGLKFSFEGGEGVFA